MDRNRKNSIQESRRIFHSPAKVNLFLRILFKRADNYHELLSVMQPISLYDEIAVCVSEGDSIKVTCGHCEVPDGRDNLAYRAAEFVLGRMGLKRAVSIDINKKIPVGAGLGGGSSDAATTLMALNEMLDASIPQAELMEMGAKLGSDVPFFILKGPALAKGRGEVLKPVKLPKFNYILINPGFHVSTAWVYNNLDLTKKAEDNNLSYSEKDFAEYGNIKEYLANDLESVTAARFPEISEIKSLLMENGALGALMSGSGPTVFGVFPDEHSAGLAYENLRRSLKKNYSLFKVQGL